MGPAPRKPAAFSIQLLNVSHPSAMAPVSCRQKNKHGSAYLQTSVLVLCMGWIPRRPRQQKVEKWSLRDEVRLWIFGHDEATDPCFGMGTWPSASGAAMMTRKKTADGFYLVRSSTEFSCPNFGCASTALQANGGGPPWDTLTSLKREYNERWCAPCKSSRINRTLSNSAHVNATPRLQLGSRCGTKP